MPASAAISNLLSATTQPDTELSDLADLVVGVPGLDARVRRYASRFHFRAGQDWSDSDRTIRLLGPKMLREVVIHQAVVEWVESLDLPEVIRKTVWLDMCRRAVAARHFAAMYPDDQSGDLAFTAGMCLDLGVAAALEKKRCFSAWYSRIRPTRGVARQDGEMALLGTDHLASFSNVAAELKFPEDLIRRVKAHHSDESSTDASTLDGVLYWADRYGEAVTALDSAEALEMFVEDVSLPLFCASEQVWKVVEEIEDDVASAAALLGVGVAEEPPFEEHLRRHVERWDSKDLGPTELSLWADVLEAQVSELEAASGSLTDMLAEVHGRDPLTKLMTHRSFLEALEGEVVEARAKGLNLWLLLIDVDGFTSMNARAGYEVGDQILMSVTDLLSRIVQDARVVGRVGADTFAVTLETDDWRIRVLAERLRAAVEGLRLDVDNLRIRLTCTIQAASLAVISENAGHGEWLSATWELNNRPGSNMGNQVVWFQ